MKNCFDTRLRTGENSAGSGLLDFASKNVVSNSKEREDHRSA